MAKRAAQFPDRDDFEALRARGAAMRRPGPGRIARAAGAVGAESDRQRHQGALGRNRPRKAIRIVLDILKAGQCPFDHQGQVDGLRGDEPQSFPRGARHRVRWNPTSASTSSSWPARAVAHRHAGHPQEQGPDRPPVRRTRSKASPTPRIVDELTAAARRRAAPAVRRLPTPGSPASTSPSPIPATLVLMANEGNGRMSHPLAAAAHRPHGHREGGGAPGGRLAPLY